MGPHPAVAAVRGAVRRALADLPEEALVLLGCSGGADSVALAAALAHEAPLAGLRAGGVTVDHRVQAGSGERARSVLELMRRLGLHPAEVATVTVGTSGGPEAAARAARRTALRSAATRHSAVAVVLAHTRDDQAETVLLGLARGSGGRSLAGMTPVSGLWRRPLLDVGRSTTRAACAALDLPVWDDPHNRDRSFTRVRVRFDVLPALQAALGPGVPEALARTGRLLGEDADALDAWASEVSAAATGADRTLAVDLLIDRPTAVRRRVLKAAALAAGAAATDLSAVHVEAMDRLLTDWHGQGPLHLPGGVRAWRACDRLHLAAPGPADRRA